MQVYQIMQIYQTVKVYQIVQIYQTMQIYHAGMMVMTREASDLGHTLVQYPAAQGAAPCPRTSCHTA